MKRFISKGWRRSRMGVSGVVAVTAIGLFGAGGCGFDFNGECNGNADCGAGRACDGWFGGRCVPKCSTDADCAADEFCTGILDWTDPPRCRKGCRIDDQCGKHQACVGGDCVAGCHVHEQCPAGQVCQSPGFTLVEEPGQCVNGCRSDSECAAGERCQCATCVANACTSNDDCAQGSFCQRDSPLLSCKPSLCTPLPAPVTCGAATCSASSAEIHISSFALGTHPLPACCAAGAPDASGFDVSELLGHSVACQAASTGTRDDACPAVTVSGFTAPGCRRPDGACGFDSDSVLTSGLGCLLP